MCNDGFRCGDEAVVSCYFNRITDIGKCYMVTVIFTMELNTQDPRSVISHLYCGSVTADLFWITRQSLQHIASGDSGFGEKKRLI